MCARLTALDDVGAAVQVPRYVREQHGVGIVHIGFGAFHRAHQAVMTDDALENHGGDWRIVGVSLRSGEIAKNINAQNGLYTVLEKGATGTSARVVASIKSVIAADAEATLLKLCDPAVRIVTLTVTEAGYGIDPETRHPDSNNPVVRADLADPDKPAGVLGLLVAAISRRRQAGADPFTVLSCDNLPANGQFLRDGVSDFARSVYGEELEQWIKHNVAFPCSMVDRITPASTTDTCKEAADLIGCDDLAAVETEPFKQWIIEDNFPSGRPKWEAGGASFVADVTPYERMKLMMLNGSHSMLAYSGYLTGKLFVRDVMQDKHLSDLVERHFRAAAATLELLPGIDYKDYASALSDRFANPSIAHQTFQIASDGTQKLPQRIFQPALEALDNHRNVRPFAFAAAMWGRFCLQRLDCGTSYELRDPRASEIAEALGNNQHDGSSLSDAMHKLPDLIPQKLALNEDWRECVADVLGVALKDGCRAAVNREVTVG